MPITNNLEDIVARQKEILIRLEAEVKAISESDLTKENETLKSELVKLQAEYRQTQNQLKQIAQENSGLKNALYEQIYSERVSILNHTAEKLKIYFGTDCQDEMNRLYQFEKRVRSRIKAMTDQLQVNRVNTEDELYTKLSDLTVQLDQKVTLARAEIAKYQGVFSEHEKADFEDLKNEQITESMVKNIAKKNNIEALVGLNIINKLGIFLIIIGVIAASQFTFFKLSDLMKGIFMFALGGGMLVAGELLNRKKANIFSLGITSGGVAVLYIALSVSYFGFHILNMYVAIMLCVLITTGAFVLSTRYNAQTIAAFALVGGYLPIFSIADSTILMYSAMVYFVVLNLLALMISFHKKWTITSFIGFFLNVSATIYITSHMIHDVIGSNFGADHIILILYILFAFVIYTFIPVLSTYYEKIHFKAMDVVLLGLNTFLSAIIMYTAFYFLKLEKYTGVMAIVFACFYLLLGRFIENRLHNEKHTQALFYLTGFAFVVLIIPFQFGRVWLTLGWLAEGLALTVYGVLKDEKNFKKGGYIINALCVVSFLLFDVLARVDGLFAYKYLAITVGSIVLLGAYIYKKAMNGTFVRVYKYFAMVNLWIYALFLTAHKLPNLLNKMFLTTQVDLHYLTSALAITVTFLIAYTVPRYRILSDFGTKMLSVLLYAVGILWLFALNLTTSPVGALGEVPWSLAVIGTVILILMGLLSVFAMSDLIKCLVMERKLGVEWYPLIVSAYFVMILTQNLVAQYNLDFTNAAISIIYVLAALSWIVYGFIKRYAFIRWFGLGLSIMAVGKLFIVDLSVLKEGYRVFSYFAFGITLLAISFVYQHFNKRLELKGDVVKNDQQVSE